MKSGHLQPGPPGVVQSLRPTGPLQHCTPNMRRGHHRETERDRIEKRRTEVARTERTGTQSTDVGHRTGDVVDIVAPPRIVAAPLQGRAAEDLVFERSASRKKSRGRHRHGQNTYVVGIVRTEPTRVEPEATVRVPILTFARNAVNNWVQ